MNYRGNVIIPQEIAHSTLTLGVKAERTVWLKSCQSRQERAE